MNSKLGGNNGEKENILGRTKGRTSSMSRLFIVLVWVQFIVDGVECGSFGRRQTKGGIISQRLQENRADRFVLGDYLVDDFLVRVRGGDGAMSYVDDRSVIDIVNKSVPLCWSALMLAIFVEVRRRWWE
jgi:hypothetical protein